MRLCSRIRTGEISHKINNAVQNYTTMLLIFWDVVRKVNKYAITKGLIGCKDVESVGCWGREVDLVWLCHQG